MPAPETGNPSPDILGDALCDALRLAASEPQLPHLDDEQWQALVSLALTHQVGPILYRRLLARPPGAVPPAALERLLNANLHAAAHGMYAQWELHQALKSLHAAGLDVIVLKGAYLAEQVYPHTGDRLMNDFDLLLPIAQLGPAISALQSLGYDFERPLPVGLDGYALHQHLPELRHPERLPIELHWTLFNPLRDKPLDLSGLWQRAVRLRLAQVEALALCPEDNLLHLAFHACNHDYQHGPRSLLEIAYLLQRFQAGFDWPAVAQRAAEMQIAAPVYLSTRLAVELFAAPVPPAALADLRPPGFDDQLLTLGRELVLSDQSVFDRITPDMAAAATDRSPLSWLKMIARRVFLPKEVLAGMYAVPPNSPRLYGYYLVRLSELWRSRRRAGLALLSGDPALAAQAQQARQLAQKQARLRELLD